ncbi:hypothetical protein GCU56_08470 [Geodermatophilus sabuli]|uniref:Uncharacterized protein n=1 Tax=Geodermatophilus sabuli TaxID=1564158 RepID=A0A7K3W0M4_9ACTN|nr:hypothetical protein [Geodermatophilus sabuli]NEK57903.1 hypothetical protein [Geodermatophilus sabuli]
MRSSHVATALAAFTAGATVTTVLHRLVDRRASATRAVAALPSAPPAADSDGVVLPFTRPMATAPAVEQPAAPARCGDNGGRTKAGTPCAARATSGGRCHHHPVAA